MFTVSDFSHHSALIIMIFDTTPLRSADCSISLKFGVVFDVIQTFKVNESKVKVTALPNDGKNLLNHQKLSRGLYDFAQIMYNL